MAWLIYHRVAMRLPYEIIAQVLEEQFNEKITLKNIAVFIMKFALYYVETERIITRVC